MIKKNILKKLTAFTATLAVGSVVLSNAALAQAGIFEVVKPKVEKGELEIEILNGIDITGIADGDARSAHEFAILYGITDFWKFGFALEVENPRNDNPAVEGFEFETVVTLPFLSTPEDGKGNFNFKSGIFGALEIPSEGGIEEGALEIGPIFSVENDLVSFTGNLLFELPFGDESTGLAFATETAVSVTDGIALGFETFGEFENVFTGDTETSVLIGPAAYFEVELPGGIEIEPRAAVLFGVTEDAPDAVFSLNIEIPIGGH